MPDLDHFGRRPIRLSWFCLVLPALLLNYFGLGALVLENGKEITHLFFHLAPPWALYPLVALATIGAVIASQAVISGVFSLTRQAVLLDRFPRVGIHQTSKEALGQIYVPGLNFLLRSRASVGRWFSNLEQPSRRLRRRRDHHHGHLRSRSRPSRGVSGSGISLFAFLNANTAHPVNFFHIPPQQVVELGVEVEI